MSMLTINETAKRTGLSTYEIRRRIKTGSCPFTKVGPKNSKFLIFFDKFIKLLEEETYKNMSDNNSMTKYDDDYAHTVGNSNIRQIG